MRRRWFFIILMIGLALHGLPGQAQETFNAVDAFARSKVSPSIARNPAALAKHLTSHLETDTEKVRAIFVWITHNIAYDNSALRSGQSRMAKIEDSEIVLKRKKAVCSGYSLLMKTLCEEAGVPCQIIEGYSRTPEDGKQLLKDPGHAWNAVYIDDQWLLLDATWAAGGMDESRGRFEKQFDESYWLAPADTFIYTHLPDHPMWQLLEQPVSAKAFIRGHRSIAQDLSAEGNTNYQYRDTLTFIDQLAEGSDREYQLARMAYQFNPEIGAAALGTYYANKAADLCTVEGSEFMTEETDKLDAATESLSRGLAYFNEGRSFLCAEGKAYCKTLLKAVQMQQKQLR